MKKQFVLLILLSCIFISTSVISQENPENPPEEPKYGWQKELVGGINVTQTSFDNWAQGGENSFAWQFNLNFKFINDQEKTNWANSGKFSYGSAKIGDQESRKSIDEIKIECAYALGRMGSKDASKALENTLKSKKTSDSVKIACIESLLTIGGHHEKKVLKKIDEKMASDFSPPVRGMLRDSLSRFPD